jgi:hypothetical protein
MSHVKKKGVKSEYLVKFFRVRVPGKIFSGLGTRVRGKHVVVT